MVSHEKDCTIKVGLPLSWQKILHNIFLFLFWNLSEDQFVMQEGLLPQWYVSNWHTFTGLKFRRHADSRTTWSVFSCPTKKRAFYICISKCFLKVTLLQTRWNTDFYLLLSWSSLTWFFLLCFSIILSSFRKPSLYSIMVMFLDASLFSLWCPEAEALIRSSIPLNIIITFTIDQTLNNMVSWGAQKSNAVELALD